MAAYMTACSRQFCTSTRSERVLERAEMDLEKSLRTFLEHDQEWTDACGTLLAANNLAPSGATHSHKGLFYKKGRSGHLCYWNGSEWVRSSKRESLLAELFPYRRVGVNREAQRM